LATKLQIPDSVPVPKTTEFTSRIPFSSVPTVLYVWPELTNRFFKTTKFPKNEVRDGKIIENEGGLRLGI
jgi:hypothetical protein